MKTTQNFGSIIALLCLTLTLQANPRIWLYFSEFQILDDDFRMELRFMGPETLDGWYLTSLTDTAYFKTGIAASEWMIISQGDLVDSLAVNPAGDVISLHPGYYEDNWEVDVVRYGTANNALVAGPNPGQSLCLLEYDNPFQTWTWYLGNTPTLGAWNDSSGAMGYIEGTVTDTLGTPQAGIQVVHFINYNNQYYEPIPEFVTTDENGFFRIEKIAHFVPLGFVVNDSIVDWQTAVQVWPEDTVVVELTLHDYVPTIPEPTVTVENFKLRSVYPNPFNSTINLAFSLQEPQYLTISVYDVRGRLADIITEGFYQSGDDILQWNADDRSAGIYFLRFQTLQQSVTRKVIYLK
ncbi:MAG: T9SS type A sorting domain-containing protein [Candidatus Marinimicrobia bacterium]|nr:T9SS type A sorting domain-containing protein [Candidatus Neomarinimicrobiota bacterium]